MKKTRCLLLIALFLLGVLPFSALAAGGMKIEPIKEFTFNRPTDEMDAFTIQNTTDHDLQISIEVYDQAERRTIQSLNLSIAAQDAPIPIKAKVYKDLNKPGNINLYRYTIRESGGAVRKLFVAQKFIGYNPQNEPVYTQYQNTHYRNNTACAYGLRFRDISPEKTKLWYTFTPVDLSVQGRQIFPLMASNMYQIGKAYVDVYGDQVIVSCHYDYVDQGAETKVQEQYLNFFTSYEEAKIPNDVPLKSYDKPATRFQIGMPFSIQFDLNGNTKAFMLMRNVVDYWRFPLPRNTEFQRVWENTDEFQAIRANMTHLLDMINERSSLPQTPQNTQ